MPVVALVGNKGGTGKTTLCVNIAAVLSKRAATIILDADPQRSSLQWRDLGRLSKKRLGEIRRSADQLKTELA